MTREQLGAAAASGVPFTLFMADGKSYPVPHRDYISFPPKSASVIVFKDDGYYTILPIRTITGLQSMTPDAGAEEK